MMTNETKAPERIYMDGDIEVGDGYWTRCFEHPKQCSEPAIEYIRADLFDAMKARIEALEAKAVQFTEGVIRYAGNRGDDYLAEQARTTIAELTGGKDE